MDKEELFELFLQKTKIPKEVVRDYNTIRSIVFRSCGEKPIEMDDPVLAVRFNDNAVCLLFVPYEK